MGVVLFVSMFPWPKSSSSFTCLAAREVGSPGSSISPQTLKKPSLRRLSVLGGAPDKVHSASNLGHWEGEQWWFLAYSTSPDQSSEREGFCAHAPSLVTVLNSHNFKCKNTMAECCPSFIHSSSPGHMTTAAQAWLPLASLFQSYQCLSVLVCC